MMSFTLIWLLSTIFSFIFQKKHLLMRLLCMEATMLSFIFMIFCDVQNVSNMLVVVPVVVLVVIEGVFGLAVLVSMSRSSSSDLVRA